VICLLASSMLLYSTASTWEINSKSVEQVGPTWQIHYKLRNPTNSPIHIFGSQVQLKLTGSVSNSGVPGHSIPKKSELILNGPDSKSTNIIISSSDEDKFCREQLKISYGDRRIGKYEDIKELENYEVPARGYLDLSIRIVHEHQIYGDYNVLLGKRQLSINLGGLELTDTIDTSQESYIVYPNKKLDEIPQDRRDDTVVCVNPYSLHLDASVPGNQYYRFSEMPVRYESKVRIRFWYLIARGTEGETSMRISQYKDTPKAWKILEKGRYETLLKPIKRWSKFDKVIQIQPDATTFAIDFRISSESEVGEAWINGLIIETIGDNNHKGP
jgi:hypothetical protein